MYRNVAPMMILKLMALRVAQFDFRSVVALIMEGECSNPTGRIVLQDLQQFSTTLLMIRKTLISALLY